MDAAQQRTRILDEASAKRKMVRMALQIAEQNAGEKAVVIAGIIGNGVTVAECVASELRRLSTIAVDVVVIHLDKKNLGEVRLHPAIDTANKVVVIVDDVANTGRTLLYALKPFLQAVPKKIQTLALVERSHKEFPIQTDYTGLSIATTLQEHIEVEVEGETVVGAWLY